MKIGTPAWDRLSLQEARRHIRTQLAARGTDVAKNDQDPEGDGDQSIVSAADSQFYRDLFSVGGDLSHLADVGLADLTPFAKLCVSGIVVPVREALEAARRDGPDALRCLLETRETSMRLSPILMVVSIGKNVDDPARREDHQVKVAELLLSYGARPDARDVCGKTVCQYGMGAMASKMTIKVCEMCIQVHKSQYLVDKKVQLHGLKNRCDLNGAVGVCKEYNIGNDRRSVILVETNETVAIKPENLMLWTENGSNQNGVQSTDWPQLYDIPDRIGVTCLLEVVQGNRVDVADLLLNKYRARVDIEDCDGISAASLSRNTALISDVAGMVNKAVGKNGRKKQKEGKRTCANCKQVKDHLKECVACRSVAYCQKECQVAHWKSTHKKECKDLAAKNSRAIVLESSTHRYVSAINRSSIRQGTHPALSQSQSSDYNGFTKPSSVEHGEKFYLKVQGSGPRAPLLLYDKSKECCFSVGPEEIGFTEIFSAVAAEPTWEGRKTFILASFDPEGKCTLYPGLTSIEKW